ncbi:MAG: ABC transporter substrate-binding protein, partial [Christensenellaceae bacterium]|nr:ABC transporter substrate-binding protein [Christensenellaceae bacterium]
KPDLVVMTMMSQSMDIKTQLNAVGIPVIVTNASSIEQVYEAISLLGKATSRDEKAEEIISNMKESFDALSKKSEAVSKKESIYFEVSPLEYGLWSTGKGTFMDEIANICGLNNVFNDIEGWKEVSQEQVLERNPDNIVTITMYFGEGPTPVEEILAREAWSNVTAVKNNKIFSIDGDLLSRPSPRLVEGAQELFNLVYKIN